ncbi:hypothetical protein MTR67_037105 [Solanum verrucosum]|uniref:RNase H type-1 domain-containing protein n=1 Tax=Solanum verrucosum TaxID=315347 RepID=A0AAF0UCV0_SOLVR|nr:hypothetical protein MTR67_037105 [Solanum verrucosum]
MIIQCIWNIKAVILNAFPVIDTEDNWINLCNKVENLRLVHSINVRWNKPSVGMIKINTDGSYFSNNNTSSEIL